MNLKDDQLNNFPKSLKWRLFKQNVDGSSEIEIVLTGAVKVTKAIKVFGKILGELLGSTIGVIPIVGSELTDLLKNIEEKSTVIGKGKFVISATQPLKNQVYKVELKAPEDLFITYRGKPSPGRATGALKKKKVVKKGQKNGELILEVRV